jgi:multimeric flavodoxin WrbA
MKILTINGSYRKSGNSAQILEMVTSRMQEFTLGKHESLELEMINLGHQNIQLCRGCRVCFDIGENQCPLKDDLLSIRAKMRAADGILLASPVYVNDVNGITKNWMDRLAFLCHRPEFAGKSAYLITTVGIGTASHALKTMKMALSTWGFQIAGQASFKMGARTKKADAEARFQEKTTQIAERFFQAVLTQADTPPSFISLITFRIQQAYWQRRSKDKSIDHTYWRNQGWTDPNRDYYTAHGAGRFKIVLARFTGALLALFVT